MAKVLLVAETTETTSGLRAALAEGGHEVLQLPPEPASTVAAAEAKADLLILTQPAADGTDQLIRHFKAHDTLRFAPILIVTDQPSAQDKFAALRIGADEYLPWPTPPEELMAHIQAMLRIRRTYNELRDQAADTELLRDQVERRHTFENIIGTSYAMRCVFDLISKVTATSTTVLITGESGTGKELVARAIHYNSTRRSKNFVIQNCSAFTDSLLETELFGHVKGSFTGAIADKLGLFQVADGGTLFLDEVGDMSPALQVKVLRVLQEGVFIPVGGTQPVCVDVRVISATNQALEGLVQQGTFREDLYYRLHVFMIELPPLRDRREDIPILADHFLQTYCSENGLAPKRFAPEVMDAYVAYDWHGNVRELENEIERVVVMARDDAEVGLEHISRRIRETAPIQFSTRGRRLDGKLSDAIQDLERAMLS
ncbi:sigma 54-interacting transcriptional regulator, partial [Planctomycetota bacterium]